jgi:hypothetical protein
VEVFLKSWVPAERPLHGVVFLCHGYGDSVIFYAEGKEKKKEKQENFKPLYLSNIKR